MTLSILIVNWNTRELVIKCLDSIFRDHLDFDFEIILVDNDSKDGSAVALREKFGKDERIKILTSPKNLGFAVANNTAYKMSQGEYILLLNPDTEVFSGALNALVKFLKNNPGVGIVGPRIINPDHTLQPSVRRFPEIWSSLVVFSGLHKFFRPRRYLMEDFDYERQQTVDQVMGAVLLTRRSLVEQLGLFDEAFYLWYEEVDFCRRVKLAGHEVVYYPEVKVLHYGAQSFAQLQVFDRKIMAMKSLRYYFSKNGSWFDVAVLYLVTPPILLLAKIIDWFKLKP